MQNLLLFSNQVDGAFFGICIAVVAIIVAIYFLIPVIYRKHPCKTCNLTNTHRTGKS